MRATLFTLFALMLGSVSLSAQVTNELEKGDDAFYNLDYDDALYYYQLANEIQPNDPNITRRIAKLYRRIGVPDTAAVWYKRSIDMGSSEPEDILFYAESLKSLRQYDEAVKWYKIYNEKVPSDSRAISHIRDTEYFLELFADSAKYIIKHLQINNSDPVIGVTMVNKNTYLISAVNLMTGANSEKNEVSAYLDVYEVKANEDFELVDPKKLNENINSKYHDGPVFYSPWDQSIYITRNNIKKNKAVIDKTGNVNTKLYQSFYRDNEWSEVVDFSFNDDEYSNAHACVSADGQTLFFVSNRPGGYGGTDLYRCKKVGETWGAPENLGPAVNTEGNEMFPFLSSIGTLYFASDGHAGLGGLDIFFSEEYNGTFLSPLNMGAPINSSSDDFSLLYDDAKDRGYFCSNRNGRGNDDVYFFQFRTLQQTVVSGNIVFEDPKITAQNETIIVNYLKSGDRAEIKLDENGAFQIVALPGDDFVITLPNNELYTSPDPLFAYTAPELLNEPFYSLGTKTLALKKPIDHSGPIGDFIEATASNDNTDNSRIEQLLAEADEHFLKNELLDAKRLYIEVLEIDSNNAYAKKRLSEIETKLKATKEKETFANATSVIDLTSSNLNQVLFDFNKTYVREEDKSILNELATILKNDVSTKVFIKAYCDSRGSKTYNEALSEKRANAISNYLISKGISKERIDMEWFGEENTLNGCTDNVPCTKEQHAVNRRAEFKITRK